MVDSVASGVANSLVGDDNRRAPASQRRRRPGSERLSKLARSFLSASDFLVGIFCNPRDVNKWKARWFVDAMTRAEEGWWGFRVVVCEGKI